MTISSTAAPDGIPHIEAVVRLQLDATPRSVSPIGAGRNSRVFKVDLDGRSVVVKFYRRDAGDTRYRLATEFGALRFLWDNGVRAVPRAIAEDRNHYCAIYEFIDGGPPAEIAAGDIDALVDFLASLQALRSKAAGIGTASEANFSLTALTAHVRSRAERLRQHATGELATWFEKSFDPLLAEVEATGDDEIDQAKRILSPSDFGFHNAIRRPDGALAFVDFEYFGWDDPAKTVVDFLLHPGMTLSDAL